MVLATRLTRRLGIAYPIVVLGVDDAQAAAVAIEGGFGLVAERPASPALWDFTLTNGARATMAEVRGEEEARRVLDLGVDLVVTRGADQAFTCWVADLISRRSHDALLVLADGIADGRGLAAALMLGADGMAVDVREHGEEAEALVRRIADQAYVLLDHAA